jgi:hypothetical protein
MSVCSNTLRVCSHSRIPPSKTLFPFLYQTSTIQQWQPATRPIARRTIASRSRGHDGDNIPFKRGNEDIPFEDGTLPPAIDEEPARKTTITGTERAAFQKLYRKFNAEGRQKKGKDDVVELDQIADEYYEDAEDNSKPSLDKVFDEVLKGEPRLRTSRTRPQRQKTTDNAFGQDALLSLQRTGKVEELNVNQRGERVDAAKLKEMRIAERERVDKLIRNASTDHGLWQVLEREVFEKVRELDLDNTSGTEQAPKTPKKSPKLTKPKSKPNPPSVNARILFQNYPHYLITAMHTFRTEFPSSTLPFAILPTIKSLGRSSHALGATTILYRHIIRTAWIQQASYTSIDTLLTEMDNNAIEFDADILALLEAILKEHNMARTGDLGREMQMVYGMEMWLEGIKKIREWRTIVAQRLGIVSQEKRNSDMVVKRVVHEKETLWRKVDPTSSKLAGQGKGGMQEDIPLVEGVNRAQDGADAEEEQADDQDAYSSSDEQLIRDHDTCEEIIRPAQILL